MACSNYSMLHRSSLTGRVPFHTTLGAPTLSLGKNPPPPQIGFPACGASLRS